MTSGPARSVRHRIRRRRPLWLVAPVLSPYEQRLRAAAVGGHRCQMWRITMPKQTDKRDDDQAAAEQPAAVPPSIEDSAVRAAREAKENDDLPDPDTDTKEHEDRAGKRSK